MEMEPEGGRHHFEKSGNGKDGNLLSEQLHEREEEETNGKEDFWRLLGAKCFSLKTCTDTLNRSVIPLLKPISVMVLLYFFICSLDLMCSALYPTGGRETRGVFLDNELLLDNHICGLLFVILAAAGVVLRAESKSIPQAVFKGSSIGGCVTTAILLLLQIPVSFSMQQGRKCNLGKNLLRCIVILLCCLSGCQGLAKLAGNPAEFSCTVENLQTSLWQVKRPDGTFEAIAQNGVVYTHFRENFRLDIENESSGNNTSYFQTLTLIEATVDDDGQYRCEEEGYIRTLTNLTVETVPVLHLEINNNVTTTVIDVVLNREVAVDCIAEGGKPPVTLSWRVNGEEKSGRFIDDPPSSSENVTSTIHLLPTMEDKTLTCVASGQEVTPQTSVSVGLNVQHLPNCILVITNGMNAYILTCSCIANPEVKKYEIYENDLLFSNERRTTLSSEKSATVFCNATNDVGSFVTQPENLKPFHGKGPVQQSKIALIIVPCVIVGVLVLGSFFFAVVWHYRKRTREAEMRANENHESALNALKLAQRKVQELSNKRPPKKLPLREETSEEVDDLLEMQHH